MAVFSLGWRIGETYANLSPPLTPPLPGGEQHDGRLDPEARDSLLLLTDRIQTRLTIAGSVVRDAGLKPPELPNSLPKGDLKDQGASDGQTRDEADQNELKEQAKDVRTLHDKLQRELWAVGHPLGMAYSLGQQLAWACTAPRDPKEDAFPSISCWTDWLRKLATLMPDHAARAVELSLECWQGKKVAEVGEVAEGGVQVQCNLWRQCLAGEKAGRDMLSSKDYLQAGRELTRIGRQELLRSPLGKATVATLVLLFLLAIAAVALCSSPAKLFGALVPIAAAMGITGKTAAAAGRRVADRVEEGVWGAELDRAIASEITTLKQEEDDTQAKRRLKKHLKTPA